eukprot:RCo049664
MNFLKNIGTIIEQASQQVQLKFPEKDGNELLQIDLEGLPHTELLDVAFKQRQLINEFAEERKKLISGFEPNGSDGQTPDILHKDSLATTETQKFGAEPEITVEVREVIQLRARNNDLSAQLETENGRIRELLDALQTLKQENARLLEEIMELKKGESQDAVAADLSQTLASEQRERQELASQLSEEVARRHALASALEQSEQELRRAKDSVREAQDREQQLAEEVSELQRVNEELLSSKPEEQNLENLQTEVSQLRATNEELHRKLSDRACRPLVAELQAEIEELRRLLSSQENAGRQTTEQLRIENFQLREQLSAKEITAREAVEGLQAENAQLRQQLSSQEATENPLMDELQAEVHRLRRQLTSQENSSSEEAGQLRGESSQLRQQLASQVLSAERLSAQLLEAQAELSKLRDEGGRSQAAQKAAEAAALEAARHFQEELSAAQRMVQSLRKQLEEAREERQIVLEQSQALQLQLAEAQSPSSSSEPQQSAQLAEQLQHCQARLAQALQQLNESTTELAELQPARQREAQHLQRLAELERALKEQKAQAEAHQASWDRERAELRKQCGAVGRQLFAAGEEVKAKELELASSKSTMEQMQIALQGLRDEKLQLKLALERTSASTTATTEQVMALRQELSRRDAELEAQQERLVHLQDLHQSHLEELSAKDTQLLQLQSSLAELERLAEAREATIQELQVQCSALAERCQRLPPARVSRAEISVACQTTLAASEVASVTAAVVEKEAQLRAMQGTLESRLAELLQLGTALAECQQRLQESESALQVAEEQSQKKLMEESRHTEEARQLQNELRGALRKLEDKEQQLRDLRSAEPELLASLLMASRALWRLLRLWTARGALQLRRWYGALSSSVAEGSLRPRPEWARWEWWSQQLSEILAPPHSDSDPLAPLAADCSGLGTLPPLTAIHTGGYSGTFGGSTGSAAGLGTEPHSGGYPVGVP